MAELLRALLSDRQHLRTELDCRQLDVARVERQVAGRAAPQLEHLATGLRADPCPSIAEEDALEEADLTVVFGRLLVLHAAHALGLLFECPARGHGTSVASIGPHCSTRLPPTKICTLAKVLAAVPEPP